MTTEPTPFRVLVIDDDPVIRRLFEKCLRLAGFDVMVVDGGAEGLRALQHNPSIGLILLDLLMPGMDGWRFRHAQRQNPSWAAIPTIVVTGCQLSEVVHAELQAADYLLKPVNVGHLVSVVTFYSRHKPSVSAA